MRGQKYKRGVQLTTELYNLIDEIKFSTVSCGQVLDRLGAINQNLVPIGKAFVLTKSLNKPETYAIEII